MMGSAILRSKKQKPRNFVNSITGSRIDDDQGQRQGRKGKDRDKDNGATRNDERFAIDPHG